MPSAGDLHCHSTFSDGSTPIEQLPRLAARAGLGWLAVSDHDTLRAAEFACAGPEREGVRLIPAVELSARDAARGRRVHILCYWPDVTCPELRRYCEYMAAERVEAGRRNAADLAREEPRFDPAWAEPLWQASGVPFKAHLMDALCEAGLADGIYGARYQALFGKGGPIRNPCRYGSVDQVLGLIRAARGVAVLAHPSVYRSMELAAELAAAGRIDGLEIDHPRNTPEDKAALHRLADRYGLLVTGGTDFHGRYTGAPHPIGSCTAPEEAIRRLGALAAARKQGL